MAQLGQEDPASPLAEPAVRPGCLTRLLVELAAAEPEPVTATLNVGDRLGRFLLVRQIGHGGFGLVFEAEDTELRRRVAVKVVRPHRATDDASTPAEWLRQEAEAAAQFRHPNVVTLYDAGIWEGGTYLVYELLQGQTLAEKLASGQLPAGEALRILGDLSRALAHLHAAGVVHRDVKASNVFIDSDGAVKLLDLGLAQITGSAGHAAGSPPYAAPEQWRGERADARADVYAWGVLAHQLLTGELPTSPPAADSQRTRSLRGLVAAARSVDPERRPADGHALASALQSLERKRARARGLGIALLGVVVVAAVLFLAWPTEREIARNVSTSIEAYRRYADGRRCLDRPSEGASWMRLDCAQHFRDALEIDPDFPLAHFELAGLARWDSHPAVAIEETFERALRRVDRLPRREQVQLRAWKAELDGDHEAALAMLSSLFEEYPNEAHVALALGEAFYRLGRHAEAVAPLERAVALDPGLELAADELVWSLGFLDRIGDLRKLADRMTRTTPSAGAFHAEVIARGWIGDFEGALEAARRAAAGGGGAAREDLEEALVATGRWEEAEAMLREDVARNVDRAPHRLESLLLLGGRLREAAAFAASQPMPSDARLRFIAGSRRLHRLAGSKDVAAIERITGENYQWSPDVAAPAFAPLLAYVGSVERAASIIPDIPNTGLEPGARELTEAILSWRRDGPRSALSTLRRLARADPTSVPSTAPEAPSWLAAECAAEVEPPMIAIEDLRRFQRFYYPLGLWRSWAYPRSLVVEARLHAASGRRPEALAALDRFDRMWARADADAPLLAEARELRRRIEAGGSIVTGPTDRRGP